MLPVRTRRYRASTSASTVQTSKATEVLRALLERLSDTASSAPAGSYPKIEELLDQIRQIHQHVAALPPPSPPQDDLRHLCGFQTLLNVLRTFSGFYDPHKRSETEKKAIFELLHAVLATLSTAFRGHPGNRRYFRDKVEGGGALTERERDRALLLCRSLMHLGIDQLADAQFLLNCRDVATSEFCLDMTEKYTGPPFIQFDLSLHGHSSIELPNLGRSFPPQTAPGYTFTGWVRIDEFDPESHTTLFGVFDSTQTCFLLAYLEKDTKNFILQTSVTSSRPSVRFKSVAFKKNQWYHIALVHRRPKTMVASKASLYVNGEFAEQIRATYPSLPPPSNASTESFVSFTSSSTKTNPLQAFLGTPRELAAQLGPGVARSKWSLASAHLFEDVLSDDLLAVFYRLGPRYQGNFQDCLGGFQTYEASAALGLRNELFHPGKDDNSDILKAIRDKASTIIPEHKVLFSTFPRAIFPANGKFMDSLLFRSLSRNAASSLLHATVKSGTAVAVNGAVPCINEALVKLNGVSLLTGDPVVATPYYFDDNLWRLGGFTPMGLKLVERSSTSEELIRSVELIFHCISNSWRNSEAMERDNGYAILSMLLRAKLGYGVPGSEAQSQSWRLTLTNEARDRLSLQLLTLVLHFVGYKHADPIESFIINPLAYRVLLIDPDTWRRSSPAVQELYYKQFVTFAVKSKHHQFNSRRLLRMRIIKRLLDVLKAETVSEDIMPHFMASFESLVRCNYSAEVHRAIALFITYAFHTPAGSRSRTPKPASISGRSAPPGLSLLRRPTVEGSSLSPAAGSKMLSKKQLGVKILEMYTRLLCEPTNLADIRKFAKTVTNKVIHAAGSKNKRREIVLTTRQWLLYLLAENDPEIVVLGCKILARLLVTHPSGYTAKFATKTGGFWIMAHRLKQWWDISTLWPILFSILFGYDVANINFEKSFDFFSLLEIFGNSRIVFPDALPVITSMLQHGLRDVLKYQDDPDSPAGDAATAQGAQENLDAVRTRPRARSMELGQALEPRKTYLPDKERVAANAVVLQTVVRFLADMHARSANFRDFALSSDYIRQLLSALYPVIVSSDPVTAETELRSNDTLNFEGGDVIIRPVPGSSTNAIPIVRTTNPGPPDFQPPSPSPGRGTPLRRPSSFILVTSQSPPSAPTPARLNHVMSPKKRVATRNISNAVLEAILELIIGVFTDQVLVRKEFPGFNLSLKVPPGFQEHHAYFETYILRNLDQKVLTEPRVLQNLARLNFHMAEAVFEGSFMNGAETMVEFTGTVLEYLQRPDVASLKSVRLCNSAVATIRASFLKFTLLRLSDMDDPETKDSEALSTMEHLLYWQTVLLGCLSMDDDFMKLLWYQLYNRLVDARPKIRLVAAMLWRIMLVQKPEESATIFRQTMTPDQRPLARGFEKLTELDDATFLEWVDHHRPELDVLFFGGMSKTWEDFVASENQRTADNARGRVKARKDKLKQWHTESLERDNILLRHEMANSAWMKSIYFTEHFKHQRLLQDQQDDNAFMASTFARMERDLRRPGAVFSEPQTIKWKLDRTEGRNRMRLRLLPEYPSQRQQEFQPKRNDVPPAGVSKANPSSGNPLAAVPASTPAVETGGDGSMEDPDLSAEPETAPGDADQQSVAPEEDFELVEDPNEPEADDTFEDKNRKVMRRLQQGDSVRNVFNISRIIGLDASEGILIIGKEALYIMDNLFQSADGEIVNVWQAPPEERDPFSIIIAGGIPSERRQHQGRTEQESRSWRWQDVLSISKRRFLFRDVAIEIFFTDGRSYLLTAINPGMRDDIFSRLTAMTPHTNNPTLLPNPEDAWRLESLKFAEEMPQTLGAKFGSIFNSSAWNPMTRRWQRGEISNFHYLMLVNTMAGRTFNDLTQYPVFPWVLADYTSEELDLNNPATFRDLSKPMGAQSPGRAADFAMRYKSLAEIGETPFHYGTHYSSAMIVSSYLIRLPPFVQSYILLQGGTFDHPDRLFFSIEGAWTSASRDNASDVRELIPEFFYLPEFLTNINGYNFGVRQGGGGRVDNVILPPWAKGDPKIFIAKHREALESPFVSQRLHQWIDLVFGYKQRGELAVENLNVFHPLSYKGARDLDNITDPQERLITTGIIHNFGQTPHQIFTKPHPPREFDRSPVKRLDSSIAALTRLPHPLLESRERVASLTYVPKLDRLLCASPFRLNLPPYYDKFLEWGYTDNSVRFFLSDNRKPAGLFENLHIWQISTLTFADSKTLITAGEDCVVSVYMVHSSPGKPAVELHPRSSLFGHKTPVTHIAVSKAFSTILTVSQDGVAFLWDLNRLEFIRKLPLARPVECARINDVTGDVMLCSGQNVLLYTLNGELILDQNVCVAAATSAATNANSSNQEDDFIHSCAFYEGSTSTGGNEWLENQLVFTGHKRGVVNVWRKTVDARTGKWVLELMRRLDHVNPKSEVGANVDAAITCVAPLSGLVYTGDDDGRVVSSFLFLSLQNCRSPFRTSSVRNLPNPISSSLLPRHSVSSSYSVNFFLGPEGTRPHKGFQLSFENPKSDSLALFHLGERSYDHILFFPTKTKGLGPNLTPNLLVDFLNAKGNILVTLSSGVAAPNSLGSLLAELDIQLPADRTGLVVDHFDYDASSAADMHDVLLLPPPTRIRPDVKDFFGAGAGKDEVLVFPRGVGASLGASELLTPILRAPRTAYSYNPKEQAEVVDDLFAAGEQLALVSAFQARNSARLSLVGSAEMLQDKWFEAGEVSKADGKKVAKTFNREFAKRHHLEEAGAANESNPKIYRIKNDVKYTISLSEYAWTAWKPFTLPDNDALQLEFSMLSPFHRLPLTLDPAHSSDSAAAYSVSFKLPDQHGIFNFKVNYKRPFLSNVEEKNTVSVRHMAHNEWPRSFVISGAWPWIAGIGVTVTGWLAFCALWMFSAPVEGKRETKKTQ
ncbi:Oligosaccharyltransferase 48 kDa subunit beta-domain-containing protein [Achaetomium macrosporum]|uniref:Beige protein homolog 1 n=1 Tax=Achaetomium macrosporum TaxID=79813 RepID=A0AAN7CFT2_9PEZI|nr:Oligosaccharyltransferase 48 kDa subunit beta-domain-containing protein [Achaetomium macrosporum]